MKRILRPVLCSALICVCGLFNGISDAKTKTAPVSKKVYISKSGELSPYVTGKKLYNEYVVAITITHNTGTSYTAVVHFGESTNGTGDTPVAAPTAITLNISLVSSSYTGPYPATIPSGSDHISENFTSTTTPSATITSVSPDSYDGFPIAIVTS